MESFPTTLPEGSTMSFGSGRILRKLGLPLWTFLGIGVAAIWFNYLGILLEKWIREHWIGLDSNARGGLSYLPQFIVFLVPFVIVIAIVIWHKARYRLSRPRWLQGLRTPEGKRGLVLLVSKPASARFAVQYHLLQKTLERVWLVPSNNIESDKFGEGTQPLAEQIKTECEELARQHGRDIEVIIHRAGVSPGDSQDTFDYVNRLFRNGGFEPREIIADFTGGTKPMSVGMIMACLPSQRELQYVSYNSKTMQSYGPFLIDYQHSAFDLIG
jgi:hypothetical protein